MEFALLEEGGKSLVVTGTAFQADARGIEIVIFGAFVLLLAWAVSGLLSMALEILIENSGPTRKLHVAIDRRASFIPRFKRRCEHLMKAVEQRNETVTNIQNQRSILVRKINKIRATKDQLVRQIEEQTAKTSCHSFLVSNRYVLAYFNKGQKHPLLDESWKNGQLVEVWAKSLIDARIMVAERYPATTGYIVEKLGLEDAPPEGGRKGKSRTKAANNSA